MAAVIDKTVIGGLTFELEAKDKVSDQVKALHKYLNQLSVAFKNAGLSSNDSLKLIEEKLRKLAKAGKIDIDVFKKLSDVLGKSSPLSKILSEITKTKNNYKFLPPPQEITSVVEALTVAAGAVRALKDVFRPTGEIVAFVNQLSLVNDRLYTLAHTSTVAIRDLAGVGSVMRGFGGGAQDYASMSRSFALAGERMRRGEGIGGNQFMEAQRRISGFHYNPADFEETMRSAMRVISDDSRSQGEKLYLKEKLGISDAMFQLMEKGEEYWNREVEEAKRRSKSSEEAAKKSREYRIAVAKLQTAWEELKNRALIGLLPVIKTITDFLVFLNDSLGENGKQILVWIFGLGTLVGAIIKTILQVGELGKAFIKLIFWIKALKTAAVAAEAAKGVSSAASGLSAGLAGGFKNAMSTGASNVLGTFTGAGRGGFWIMLAELVEGVIADYIKISHLSDINETLKAFYAKWCIHNGELGAYDDPTDEDYGHRYDNTMEGKLLRIVTAEYDVTEHINKAVWEIAKHYNIPKPPPPVNTNGDNGTQITVERIDISVEGGSSAAPDIAKEVHKRIIQEFVVLAETGAVTA